MEQKKEKALIVGVELSNDKIGIDTSLDELEELVKAANAEVVARISQKKDHLNATYFIGKGKAEEIKEYADSLEVDFIVFNDELSGAQLRNLEELIDKKIIDRTTLILDIFAQRAITKEGRLQVKLAQMKYRLPRLIGFRDYLSREGAGIGTRGPGEQKLETDRRHIMREIKNIENQLMELTENREVKRKKRLSSGIPMVALVGYTNAGKSTLTNQLMQHNSEGESSKRVFEKDMLFATLDTSHRIAKLENGQDYILIDTVGFVSKLPTKLIEAFKGTLEEAKYADLLIHVVDASNKDLDIQINTTMSLLKELGLADKPVFTVFNKMDLLKGDIPGFEASLIGNSIYVCAKDQEDISLLRKQIAKELPHEYRRVRIKLPLNMQSNISSLMKSYQIEDLEYEADGTSFSLTINSIDYERYKKYLI